MNFQKVIAMNKRSIRSFAFGIFFAVSFIGASTHIFEEKSETTVKEAKALLKKEGFITISEEEYENLKAKKEEAVEEPKDKVEPPTQEQETENLATQYELEIVSGMNTSEIARILEEAHIIDDEQDFEQFLIEHDYNTKVQIGVFDLDSEMDYEEIAKKITKS